MEEARKTAADTVIATLDATCFPDKNFLNYVKRFDTDGDGRLSQSEADAVTSISVSGKGISDLKGIAYFRNMSDLSCADNQLTELDMSGNASLEFLYCPNNRLKTLNVSGNKALEYLSCSNNLLKKLDVSKNQALKFLYCPNNDLTKLNINANKALEYLDCSGNQLKKLEVGGNQLLEALYCDHNQLTELNLKRNPKLYYLHCADNRLYALDVSANPLLSKLRCAKNRLAALHLNMNIHLSELSFEGQERTVRLRNTDAGLLLDMAALVGRMNLARITGMEVFHMRGDGTVLFRKGAFPEKITYVYDTNRGGVRGTRIGVTLSLVEEAAHEARLQP